MKKLKNWQLLLVGAACSQATAIMTAVLMAKGGYPSPFIYIALAVVLLSLGVTWYLTKRASDEQRITRVSAEDVVNYLNSLLEIDPEAISEAWSKSTVFKDPNCSLVVGENNEFTFVGLLNGLYTFNPLKGGGPIAAVVEDGKILRFQLNHKG